eukprot:TRINITY_DN19355_c0_g1_i5.p1 TRINITY_DN19355_c0_g1~~TRINITY_DN19355_c0_g1_i5.p1  ORF type:complete len:272 (-),score=32.71 TRINITY_DN19355_c0_g1_i5:456-1271(-)
MCIRDRYQRRVRGAIWELMPDRSSRPWFQGKPWFLEALGDTIQTVLMQKKTGRKVIGMIPEHDMWCVATGCRVLARICREVYPAGWRTSPDGVLSSMARCRWAYLHLSPNARPPWYDERLCALIAGRGDVEMLEWAKEQGCRWDESTCSAAALNGHWDLLDWARLFDCRWDWQTCSNAALRGHLGILQWARQCGCEWNSSTCACAAQNGHLDCLQWARANGCDWGPITCSSAGFGGHLKVLQWARANGCPWDRWTRVYAAQEGAHCLDVVF